MVSGACRRRPERAWPWASVNWNWYCPSESTLSMLWPTSWLMVSTTPLCMRAEATVTWLLVRVACDASSAPGGIVTVSRPSLLCRWRGLAGVAVAVGMAVAAGVAVAVGVAGAGGVAVTADVPGVAGGVGALWARNLPKVCVAFGACSAVAVACAVATGTLLSSEEKSESESKSGKISRIGVKRERNEAGR